MRGPVHVSNEYATIPNWILWAFIVIGILMMTASIAHAEPRALCPYLTGNVAECEVHGVPDFTVHWETTINSRVAQHTTGITVYLTVDDKWRVLRIYIITATGEYELFNGYIRVEGNRVVFGTRSST